jgi:cell division protein FtsW
MRVVAPRLAACALLALLCALQALAMLRSPPAWVPARIDIALAPGAAIVLGRAELAAPGIGARHLRLRRDEHGRWWVAGTGGEGALQVERGTEHGRRQLPSASLVLGPGMRFQLGALHYTVESIAGGALRFNDGTHAWRYDGATLWRDGEAWAACPGAAPGARLLGAWNRWLPVLAVARPLVFGGSLSCATRIGNPHAAPGSAVLQPIDGAFVLAAPGGARGGSRPPLLVEDGALPFALALAEQPLEGVRSIVVGRTRMQVSLQEGRHEGLLQLVPSGRVAVSAVPRADLPGEVRWQWDRRDFLSWPAAALPWALAALLAGASIFVLAGHTACRRDRAGALRLGAGAALAVAGLGQLLAQRAGAAPGLAWSLLPCWAALWYALGWRLPQGQGGPLLGSAVLLLAAGLLLQLELGLGAPDTAWLRHVRKTAAATTFGLGLAGLVAMWPRRALPRQATVESLLLLLAAAAMAGLLLQVGWGNETGVFDVQPVELAKLALAVLAAHCMALGLGGAGKPDHNPGGALLRGLRLSAPALLFVLLLGVALVQVDDYSPLILLLVWAAAMLLTWSFAAQRPAAAAGVALLACACLAALALLRGAGPDAAAQWSFYGERFGVWLDPAAHPHTGAQLLLGAGAIAGGGWFGADGAFGLASLGQGALEALAIPAVQDDFAPSFLLLRHGLLAALALWALQALFLCALLRAALCAWRHAAGARDFRQAWLGRFRCFLLCGGGAFVFGHFLLSWGTNLAFFPIMGQPMSFLSAGGSHLLFFIFPLLAFAVAGAPSTEENPSCRSTSNTKP